MVEIQQQSIPMFTWQMASNMIVVINNGRHSIQLLNYRLPYLPQKQQEQSITCFMSPHISKSKHTDLKTHTHTQTHIHTHNTHTKHTHTHTHTPTHTHTHTHTQAPNHTCTVAVSRFHEETALRINTVQHAVQNWIDDNCHNYVLLQVANTYLFLIQRDLLG